MDNITTAVVTLITVLFSAGAWKFYETRMKLKSELMKGERLIKICLEMILENVLEILEIL